MTVVWSERAEASLHIVERYILTNFGEKARSEFMQAAEETANRLVQFPNTGKMEPLLAHRSKAYRSIVINRRSKLIYYVDETRIVIADFWECRREPSVLKQGL
ncbi:MAG: type II toxin-antitoxin system RelE/ParE family toxin [Paludibacteraceae bacterium]|nr:type II toxin-antitoxin system RelE/ParE family toxin [Paludibacteraceae bacterium]